MANGSETRPETADDAVEPPAVPPRAAGGYELLEPERPAAEPLPEPTPPDAPAATFDPASEPPVAGPGMIEFPDEPPAVDELWNRWVEWKDPLLWSGAGVAGALLIALGGIWVATLLMLVALSYGAYMVVISLEIPVRVTAEQAAREYYLALCHRLPNLRRMYALLTSDGKRGPEFSNYGEFRAYWMARLAALRQRPTWWVPLEFRVESFRCRYNEDKSLAAIRYTLVVAHRGSSEGRAPIAEFEIRSLAVKGGDGQWYLNEGRLPDE